MNKGKNFWYTSVNPFVIGALSTIFFFTHQKIFNENHFLGEPCLVLSIIFESSCDAQQWSLWITLYGFRLVFLGGLCKWFSFKTYGMPIKVFPWRFYFLLFSHVPLFLTFLLSSFLLFFFFFFYYFSLYLTLIFWQTNKH